MHVHDYFRSLAGRFSTYLLAFTYTKRGILLVHQNPLTKVIPDESTIPTYMRYYPAVPSKFACATSKISNEHLFCMPLMERRGVVSILHAKRVILMMSVYSLILA